MVEQGVKGDTTGTDALPPCHKCGKRATTMYSTPTGWLCADCYEPAPVEGDLEFTLPDPSWPTPVEVRPTLHTEERIAAALERIADALEKQSKGRVIVSGGEVVGIEESEELTPSGWEALVSRLTGRREVQRGE